MAFPTVVNSASSNSGGSASTSLSLTMPASLVSGRLLVAIGCVDVNDAGTTNVSGWTAIVAAQQRTSGTGTIGLWGKVATGSDTGSYSGSSGLRSALVYQVDGWSGSLSDVTATLGGGALSTLDPPAHTPGFGALDYLWLAICRTNSTSTPGTAPTNYTGLVSAASGNNRLVSAQRNLNASSENPGTFTGGTGSPLSATLAVRPAAALDITDVYRPSRGPNYRR